MIHWTLRAKLTAWSALVVTLALVFCGVAAVLFIQREQIRALDEQLRNEAHTFFAEVARQGSHLDWAHRSAVKAILPLTQTERCIRVVRDGGPILFETKHSRLEGAEKLSPGMSTLTHGRTNIRLGIFQQNGLTLYVGAALNEINSDKTELLRALLVGVPLLAGIVAAGGWWIARKALGPVSNITAATEQINAHRLDQRLPIPAAQDEIGRLATVLNAMFDRLEKGFHQAKRFSADASHELKTPLTILRTGIEELLESPALTDPDRQSASELLEQTRRLASIIDGLLLLSRADAGVLALDLVETDICEVILGCIEDASIMAEEREITIETQLPPTLVGAADSGRLTQILLNLLDNAVKYNRPGGEIRISAGQEDDGRIFIRVANTGDGIPAEKSAQIFRRFFRLETTAAQGHGLGLSIARELARAHGGDLTLDPSEEGWTVFVARLPAARQPAPQLV